MGQIPAAGLSYYRAIIALDIERSTTVNIHPGDRGA